MQNRNFTQNNQQTLEAFRGLESPNEAGFPKKCFSCGRVYASLHTFLRETQPVPHGSGLSESHDDELSLVEVYRNCPCGSTLMNFCLERRNKTLRGKKRRIVFNKILEYLVRQGFSPETAHQELLKVVRGEDSDVLESIGIKVRNRHRKE